ncbi:hypothetical protein ACFL6G_09185 [candidate division KSB1 bacterium]
MNRDYFFSQTIIKFIWSKLKSKKQKLLEEIREQWGLEIDRKRNSDLISVFFRKEAEKSQEYLVDDKTWYDLNMDEIFSKIDRTATPVGRQYLYKMLRTYEDDEKVSKVRTGLYEIFSSEISLRENIQLKLNRIRHNDNFYIADMIFGALPDKPKGYLIIYFTSFSFVLSFLFAFIYKPLLLSALFFAFANLIIKRIFDKRIFESKYSLFQFRRLLQTGIGLSKLRTDKNIPKLESLKKNSKSAESLLKKMGLLLDEDELSFTIWGMIVIYLYYFCLVDLISYCRSVGAIKQHINEIREIYRSVGEIDALISISSYLTCVGHYTVPSFNEDNIIEVSGIYHPLLTDPACNTFFTKNRSTLITGSNMAGKTTFIRTIAVNLLLARTINICLAEKANLPLLSVKTSITREDSISEEKSYYFRHVEDLAECIKLSEEKNKYLFAIDEIFKGTNTVERIAAATSVLKYLGKNNIVLVTTHDIELQDLLKDYYVMFHFSEQVENEKYYFNYIIKPGPCDTRNAIRLLELKGYPASVTDEAYEFAEEL